MNPGVVVPLGVFALVSLIVAITSVAALRDKEMQVRERLYREELEHQRKIKELALELERVKTQASVPPALSLSVAQSKARETDKRLKN